MVEQPDTSASIAIIGMSGRFPGAQSIEEFWRNISNGIESITCFSDKDLLEAGVDSTLLQDSKYVKARPILNDIDCFDAAFFGFSPREAELMDPQQRIFWRSVGMPWNMLVIMLKTILVRLDSSLALR